MKYTLQLAAVTKKVFAGLSEERIERLARSLWVSTHNGSWWNITLGVQPKAPVNIDGAQIEARDEVLQKLWTPKSVAKEMVKNPTLTWTPNIGTAIAQSVRTVELENIFKEYRLKLNEGEYVSIDLGLIASYVPWLAINEKPESPTFSVLQILENLMANEAYIQPKKAREFIELFPPIQKQALVQFGTDVDLSSAAALEVDDIVRITDAQQLSANAEYMGNCTNGLRSRMERGSVILFRFSFNGTAYNVALKQVNDGTWRVQEMNSRFNRGGVPKSLKNMFDQFAERLTGQNEKAIEQNKAIVEANKQAKARMVNRTVKVL